MIPVEFSMEEQKEKPTFDQVQKALYESLGYSENYKCWVNDWKLCDHNVIVWFNITERGICVTPHHGDAVYETVFPISLIK
jgi:hypothetical protein